MRRLVAILISVLLIGEKAVAHETTTTEVGTTISAFLNGMTCSEISSSYWATGRIMRNHGARSAVSASDLLPSMIAYLYAKGVEAGGGGDIGDVISTAQRYCEENPSAAYVDAFK